MASLQKAADQIARITGQLPATIFRLGRLLREAPGGDLFPVGASGRGREAHVHPDHLVNLTIGLAANPHTSAVDLVREVRSLVPNTSSRSQPFIRGATFAEALANRIDDLASNSLPPAAYRSLTVRIVRIGTKTIFTNLDEDLHVEGSPPEGERRRCVYAAPHHNEPITDLPPNMAGAPRYTFEVDQDFINLLVDLWRDTKSRSSSHTFQP